MQTELGLMNYPLEKVLPFFTEFDLVCSQSKKAFAPNSFVRNADLVLLQNRTLTLDGKYTFLKNYEFNKS